jgi:hypothetical protein
VAFKIQATTTASVIWKLKIIMVIQWIIKTNQLQVERKLYPYALLVQSPASSNEQVTSRTVLRHSS